MKSLFLLIFITFLLISAEAQNDGDDGGDNYDDYDDERDYDGDDDGDDYDNDDGNNYDDVGRGNEVDMENGEVDQSEGPCICPCGSLCQKQRNCTKHDSAEETDKFVPNPAGGRMDKWFPHKYCKGNNKDLCEQKCATWDKGNQYGSLITYKCEYNDPPFCQKLCHCEYKNIDEAGEAGPEEKGLLATLIGGGGLPFSRRKRDTTRVREKRQRRRPKPPVTRTEWMKQFGFKKPLEVSVREEYRDGLNVWIMTPTEEVKVCRGCHCDCGCEIPIWEKEPEEGVTGETPLYDDVTTPLPRRNRRRRNR